MGLCLLFVAIGLFSILWHRTNKRLFNDILSPFYLLYFSWILPLLLTNLQLSNLESDWKPESILIISWVTLCLTILSIVPSFMIKVDYFISRKKIFFSIVSIFQNKIYLSIVLLFYFVCALAYIYSEFINNPFGLPLISVLQGNVIDSDAHRWAKESKWSIITPFLFILTPMIYFAFKANKSNFFRIFFLFGSIFYPFMGLIKLSRSDFFIGLVNILFIEYYYRKYSKSSFSKQSKNLLPWYVLLILGTLTIFYWTLNIRIGASVGGADVYSNAIEFGKHEFGYLNEIFAQIYGYVAMPFENFHRFFENYTGGFNVGISALRPFLSIVAQGYIADEMISKIFFEPVSSAAGSATFLKLLYAELGIYGLVFVPIVYASLVNILYLRFRKIPNFTNVFLYLNFVYPWLWLFFNNAFSVLSFYLNGVFIICIHFIFRIRISTMESSNNSR